MSDDEKSFSERVEEVRSQRRDAFEPTFDPTESIPDPGDPSIGFTGGVAATQRLYHGETAADDDLEERLIRVEAKLDALLAALDVSVEGGEEDSRC